MGNIFAPGGHLNINMLSYQYRESHVKDKTVSLTVLSLTWESPYLEKMVFILRLGPGLNPLELIPATIETLSFFTMWVFDLWS